MKTVLLLISAVVLASTTPVLIIKSDSTSTIVGTNTPASYPAYHNANQPNYLATGSEWIWSSLGDNSRDGTTVSVQNLFYAECTGPITIFVTADSSFSAYLNGNLVATGDDWQVKYNVTTAKLNCGNNNFTVQGTRGRDSVGVGINFAIFQDQSGCFACGDNGFWSQTTCSCQCIYSGCACPTGQKWLSYPYCSCFCPFNFCFLSTNGRTSFNPTTCGCECPPKWCAYKQYWSGTDCLCFPILT